MENALSCVYVYLCEFETYGKISGHSYAKKITLRYISVLCLLGQWTNIKHRQDTEYLMAASITPTL